MIQKSTEIIGSAFRLLDTAFFNDRHSFDGKPHSKRLLYC
nr:MAG TPA: hypothetical protein [Caudoviricetes sp.]DAM02702.1 MAG TPA: hypothetical protein [Caudoviricetes sp.]